MKVGLSKLNHKVGGGNKWRRHNLQKNRNYIKPGDGSLGKGKYIRGKDSHVQGSNDSQN